MVGQRSLANARLQGCKLEVAAWVARYDELHGAVAQIARAIEENERIKLRFRGVRPRASRKSYGLQTSLSIGAVMLVRNEQRARCTA